MLNFTVGPVQSNSIVKEIGSQDVPYFRTPEFSAVMKENERLMKKFADAEESARTVFLTGSGTAAMEAAVMNFFNSNDRVLIVNGGSFGQRFVEICKIHDVPFTEIKLDYGESLDKCRLDPFNGKGYTGFLVNIHETSTGVLYDAEIIADFCRNNNLFLVVDAVSSFLADHLSMREMDIGALITGSQKALACPPGISIIVISEKGQKKIFDNDIKSMYFDLEIALKNGERGQTPFTPAVGTLLQIHQRLIDIDSNGGVETEQRKIAKLANDFRSKMDGLPIDILPKSMSNAVTSLCTRNCSATEIFNILKDEFGIWVCPNGGDLKERVFRVGHLGELTLDDNKKLIDALNVLMQRNVLK